MHFMAGKFRTDDLKDVQLAYMHLVNHAVRFLQSEKLWFTLARHAGSDDASPRREPSVKSVVSARIAGTVYSISVSLKHSLASPFSPTIIKVITRKSAQGPAVCMHLASHQQQEHTIVGPPALPSLLLLLLPRR